MFATSSQRKYWIFEKEEDLAKMRSDTHREFIERTTKSGSAESNKNFLTEAQELHLCRHYEFKMRELCQEFVPKMPNYVLGTAFNYFKRFYLRNSVMDFHPDDISLTCVYLAAKIEEFYVSTEQFVKNVGRDPRKITETIINNELLLMQKLSHQLTIHSPFESVEDFFIDMKKARSLPSETVESLRPIVENFLDLSFLTDVCLLFSSSQIALAAILYAAKKRGVNLDSYIKNVLLGSDAPEKLPKLLQELVTIRKFVTVIKQPSLGLVKKIQKKLALCQNEENNPESETNKRKMQEKLEEKEKRRKLKYALMAERQKQAERELLGMTGKGQDSN